MEVGSQHRVRDAIKHVYGADGVRGFYKGFSISALNIVVSQVNFAPFLPSGCWFIVVCCGDSQLYITLFEFSRRESILGSHTPEPLRNFIAGIFAVATSQLAGNPIDVLANRVMAAGGLRSSNRVVQATATLPESTAPAFNYRNVGLFNGGAMRAVRHILAKEGWRGMYHGYSTSVALNAPTSGIWWAIYGTFYLF